MDERSKHLRRLVVRALEGGDRGHIGASMSLIEIFRVLYDDIIDCRPDDPFWPYRDRVILSKGHGCLAQYVMLAEKGFFPLEALDKFCRYERLEVPVPPQYNPDDGIKRTHDVGYSLGGLGDPRVPGMDYAGGSLGHGLGVGVGMALALRQKGFITQRIFVVMGDGECDEGSVWEAAAIAAHHKLTNLVLIIDQNGMQSAGSVGEITGGFSLVKKLRSFGWGAWEIPGHDVSELRHHLRAADGWSYPNALICHTIKGKGITFAENNLAWHHRNSFTVEEIAAMKEALA